MAVKRHFHLVFGAIVAVAAAVFVVMMLYPHGGSVFYKENAVAGRPLPEAAFYNASGQKVSLADFKGKVVLVNLWATWCPPCVVELPALDSLQARLKDRDFRVVAVALDRSSITTVESFLKSHDIEHLEPYWDQDRQIPLKWRYEGLPTSFLLDKNGDIVQRFDGPQDWNAGEIPGRIEALLK